MASINTRNVHRSNMLMGFPYGRHFVYDEVMLTGPGEQGEERARRILAANTSEKMEAKYRYRAKGRRSRSANPATMICCLSASRLMAVRYAPL